MVRGDTGWVMRGQDDQTIPILSYDNGSGFADLTVRDETLHKGTWRDMTQSDILGTDEHAAFDYRQPSGVPLDSETHGGNDVGIWAAGPMV